jgi:hypothetical protein
MALVDRLSRELGALVARHDARKAARDFSRYRDDPVGFAVDVLRVDTLWGKQTDLLGAVAGSRLTTAVSANGVGKSFTAAVLLLWWVYCRGPSVVLSLAPTEAQNRTLWRTIRTFWLAAGDLGGELYQQGLTISDQHFALGRATSESGRLTGLHAPRLLVLLDEAQNIEPAIWEAAFALASGEQNAVVAIGNPGPRVGKWYDVCQSPAWAHVQVSALDHPNVVAGREVIPGAVSRQAVDDIAREYGTDSGVYRTRVLGEFSDDAATALVRREWVDAAVVRWHTRELAAAANGATLHVGVDLARQGADTSAVAIAFGGHVEEVASWHSDDLMVTRDRIVAKLVEHNADGPAVGRGPGPYRPAVIAIDTMTLGGAIHDDLARAGWPVEAFVGSARADEPSRFYNRRAEAAFRVRRLFADGAIAIPPDARLVEELLALNFAHRPDGRIVLDGKPELRSRLGRSPDKYDSLMMAVGAHAADEAHIGGDPDVIF